MHPSQSPGIHTEVFRGTRVARRQGEQEQTYPLQCEVVDAEALVFVQQCQPRVLAFDLLGAQRALWGLILPSIKGEFESTQQEHSVQWTSSTQVARRAPTTAMPSPLVVLVGELALSTAKTRLVLDAPPPNDSMRLGMRHWGAFFSMLRPQNLKTSFMAVYTDQPGWLSAKSTAIRGAHRLSRQAQSLALQGQVAED